MAKRRRSGRRPEFHRTPETDDGVCEWVAYGETRMFVVGYTSGGVPYGWIEGEDGSWLDEDDHPQPDE